MSLNIILSEVIDLLCSGHIWYAVAPEDMTEKVSILNGKLSEWC